MEHLRDLGNRISVPIVPDESGFTGRECPQADCEGYFKIEFGTGLKGEGLPCHCPYCGHTAGHDHFWTREQLEYAKSVAMRKITDAARKDLKKLEFDFKPKGAFGFGFSMKVKEGRPIPVHRYREKKLETEITCSNCSLRYSIYGVFAFCPDCGQHNSLQILEKNLEVIGKMLDLAAQADKEVAERMIENALEDCVSAFDGFGREVCRIYRKRAADAAKADKASFQNLERAKAAILGLFGIDLSVHLTADEWQAAVRSFQKRHVLAHRMGVIDPEYVTNAADSEATVGRKVTVASVEVRSLISTITKLAQGLGREFAKGPGDAP